MISYLDFGADNLKAAKLTSWDNETSWDKINIDTANQTGWYPGSRLTGIKGSISAITTLPTAT